MESTWDKLVTVQARLNYLDNKWQRIMSARFKEIHEGATGPDEVFTAQVATVANELKELWPEKRYLLSQLKVPEEWSWISPVITNLAVSQGPLQMFGKNPQASTSQ